MDQKQQQAFNGLLEAIKKQDTKQIFQTSKKLLVSYPDDKDYLECFALSGIRIHAFAELKQGVFKKQPTAAFDNLKHLYAYYLYSWGDYKGAVKYLENSKLNTNKSKLLEAHSHFWLLNYEKSAEIMCSLLKENKNKLSSQDRESYTINLLGNVDRDVKGQLKMVRQYIGQTLNKNSFKELYFNYALVLLQIGKWQESQQQLQSYQRILEKQQESQEDKLALQVLKSFIEWQKSQGKYSQLQILRKIKDSATKNAKIDQNLQGVLQCNILASQSINTVLEDFNLAQKIFDDSMNISVFRTTRAQLIRLKINKVSLLLMKNKITEASKILKEVQSLAPSEYLLGNKQYVKNRYYILKKSKDEKQITELLTALKSLGQEDFSELIYIDYAKQMQNQGNLIKQYKDKIQQQNPVIKNYIFSLLISDTKNLEAQTKYLEQLTTNSNDIKVLQILIQIYQSTKNQEKQRFVIQKLLKINPKNVKAKTRLARLLLNQGKYMEAQQLLRGIDGPEQITDFTYLQYIEKNMHVSIKKQQEPEQTVTKHLGQKKIRKKKRTRLPKGAEFIDNFKPDPERWLPKWQRKGYKKKGGKKGSGKTQGLATVGRQETKNVYATGASTSNKEVTKEAKKKR